MEEEVYSQEPGNKLTRKIGTVNMRLSGGVFKRESFVSDSSSGRRCLFHRKLSRLSEASLPLSGVLKSARILAYRRSLPLI